MSTLMPHVVTGQRDQVYAALHRAYTDGRLVSITDARVLPNDRVQLVAHLRAPARSRWERVRSGLLGAGKLAAALTALAAVGGLVWLVVLAVMSLIALVAVVIAWIHAHLAVLVASVVVLVLLVMAGLGGGGCAGVHCGGCRR